MPFSTITQYGLLVETDDVPTVNLVVDAGKHGVVQLQAPLDAEAPEHVALVGDRAAIE